MDIATAQAFLDEKFAPWVPALQPRVLALTSDGATLEIPITPKIARTGNIVSGQTLATRADMSMVIACGAAAGEMIPVGTVTLDTQFLRPASGQRIVAQAEVTRPGKAMAVDRATLTAEPSGRAVAVATATFAR